MGILKRRVVTIFEGPVAPSINTNPRFPTPFWRDTSGPEAVLMMYNADRTGWVAVSSAFMTPMADSTATDVPGLVADFNALLANLRAAGLMGPVV